MSKGACESCYFSHIYNRYGDLRDRVNFIEFAEVVRATDYFRLAGISRSFLYSLWPGNYITIFRTIMDHYALQNKATFWLEKTPMHSLLSPMLAAAYPDAKFIGITRDFESGLASHIPFFAKKMTGHRRLKAIIILSIIRVYYRKIIEDFTHKYGDRAILISYEELLSDTAGTLKRICTFIGVDYCPSMEIQAFPRASSFESEEERKYIFTTSDFKVARLCYWVVRFAPLPVLRVLHMLYHKKGRRRLPSHMFKMTSFTHDD